MINKGTLFVVSGPSGAGKTTLTAWAIKEIPNLRYSISYTSRRPREGERHGIEYFFVNADEFQRMITAGEFLEWAQVHGYYYGTHRAIVQSMLDSGYDIILDIDVQGALALQQKFSDAVLIFIFPPTFHILMERITNRNLDTEETIRRRMQVAEMEMAAYKSYDYLIINNELENAQQELKAIILAHRCRRAAREHLAEAILQSFK